MAAEDGVLTVELKINLLAPARGVHLIARAQVLRAGHRLTVARSNAYALANSAETHMATALGTFMTMSGIADKERTSVSAPQSRHIRSVIRDIDL